jgi:hypothetical protein
MILYASYVCLCILISPRISDRSWGDEPLISDVILSQIYSQLSLLAEKMHNNVIDVDVCKLSWVD